MPGKNYSPLRYPGGKNCLTDFITQIAINNNIVGGHYCELYAGGAGAALNLLFNDVFSTIHINDFDYKIYCIWDSILNHTEDFVRMINDTPVTLEEWHHQKQIFESGEEDDMLRLGFATFFLNRTNRSGIIFKAGPIGGINQTGNYKIDVRFNKDKLISRIQQIAAKADRITLTNEDAIHIIENIEDFHNHEVPFFLYMDPPYYQKGSKLYMNNYLHRNHELLQTAIEANLTDYNWLVSYDNVDEIKYIYKGYRMSSFDLNYTLQTKKFGSELLIFSEDLLLPNSIKINSRETDLILF